MISSLNKLKRYWFGFMKMFLYIYLSFFLWAPRLHVAIYFIMILASLDTFFCDVILDATRNYFYISHIDILRALFSHEKFELLFLFHPWVYKLYLIWHCRYNLINYHFGWHQINLIVNVTRLLEKISYFL